MEDQERVIKKAITHGLIKNPSDVQIAYDRGFQTKAAELSKLFEEHYADVTKLSDIQLVRIFRYFMGKAAETCIADDLYMPDEKRICNVVYRLSDVDKEFFEISIPAHYMFELSDLAMHYLLPLQEDIEDIRLYAEIGSMRFEEFEEDFKRGLSSALIYWQIVSYSHAHLRKSYACHGQYDNKSIKTLDEIRICALRGTLQNLSANGWKIEKMNYLLSNPWNIIGQHNGEDFMLLLRTNYGRFNAGITLEELKKLVDCAKDSKEKNYAVGYILVDINSANEQHKEDHVIIIGDQMEFRIKDVQLYQQK